MSITTIPNTWQEAFDNHSIPNVRALEKQLRAGALRDKEKLRVIVGSNYRDVLATAEKIVQLNLDARNVESSISLLSQACKPQTLQAQTSATSIKTELTCHLKLLDQLLRCASRSVKQQSVLLASKMLIIARPLLKHIEDKHGNMEVTKWFHVRLRSLRTQVTSRINTILLKPSSSLNDLVQCSGAYCLLTSSSSIDAIKHFQNIRMQRLSLTGDDADSSSDLKQSCHYLITSAITIKALSGRSLVELLNDLQKRPILDSPEIQSLETLQLDINRDVLPHDIVTFVPYFKRDTLSKSALQRSVVQWVSEAMEHVLHRIRAVLATSTLLKTLKIRQEVFEILLPSCFSSALYGEPLESVRNLFAEAIIPRIQQLAEATDVLVKKLHALSETTSSPSLWSSSMALNSSKTSTPSYLRKVQHQHLGITGDLNQFIQNLSQWSRRVQKAQEAIQTLSKIKWYDKLEDYDDENEDVAHKIVASLSKEDPQKFVTSFSECLHRKSNGMVAAIGEQATKVANAPSPEGQSEKSIHAATFLRALRETRALLKTVQPDTDFPALTEATSTLLGCLIQQVTGEFFISRESMDPIKAPSSFVPDDLPSPLTISALQGLCMIMLQQGGHDLWSAVAVRQLGSIILNHIMSEDIKRFYIASEFDEHYLRLAFGAEASEIVDSKRNTGYRRAAAYWNRTKTLFGILNV